VGVHPTRPSLLPQGTAANEMFSSLERDPMVLGSRTLRSELDVPGHLRRCPQRRGNLLQTRRGQRLIRVNKASTTPRPRSQLPVRGASYSNPGPWSDETLYWMATITNADGVNQTVMVNASEQGEVTVLDLRGRGGLRRGEDTGETVNVEGVNPPGSVRGSARNAGETEVPEGERAVPDPRSMSPT